MSWSIEDLSGLMKMTLLLWQNNDKDAQHREAQQNLLSSVCTAILSQCTFYITLMKIILMKATCFVISTLPVLLLVISPLNIAQCPGGDF